MKTVNLDTTRQKDLYEQACRDMAARIPGWSDKYPSDPAVAILEYLTYLSDIQNYRLNLVRDEHYLAYVKMLGQYVRRARPAELLAMPDPEVSCFLGQRFTMSGMEFEVDQKPKNGLPEITSVRFQRNTREDTDKWTMRRNIPMQLPGGKGGLLTVTFDGELPAGEEYAIWFLVNPEPGRNPPEEDTCAPVQFLMKNGEKLQPCEDETCGFLRSGTLSFTLETAAREVVFQVKGQWEGKPEIVAAVLEPVHLIQQRTCSAKVDLTEPFKLPQGWAGNRVLYYFTPVSESGWYRQTTFTEQNGYVTGWMGHAPSTIRVVALEPNFKGEAVLHGVTMERVFLDEQGIQSEDLRVMIEEGGIWHDCPIGPPDPKRTLLRGCRWESEKQSFRFGDGRDYLIPKPGKVLISGCLLTRGGEANGVSGVLTGENGQQLTALTKAADGQNADTPKEAFLRAAEEQNKLGRAVTCEDYEQMAHRTPGLALEQVRGITKADLKEKGPGIVVLAKPKSDERRPRLTPWQRQQLTEFLEPIRLMGVPIEIRGARYCPIHVRVLLKVSEPVAEELLRQAALPLTDGVDGPLDFGDDVSYTALYAALGSVPHVRSVRRLELISMIGGVKRLQDGSIRPAPDMLPCLARFEVIE